MNYWMEVLQLYVELCTFVGLLLVTSAFVYSIVAFICEFFNEFLKPTMKKVFKDLALRVYRACK